MLILDVERLTGMDREFHPWYRYFARYLDYQLIAALLHLLLITALRIRWYTRGKRSLQCIDSPEWTKRNKSSILLPIPERVPQRLGKLAAEPAD